MWQVSWRWKHSTEIVTKPLPTQSPIVNRSYLYHFFFLNFWQTCIFTSFEKFHSSKKQSEIENKTQSFENFSLISSLIDGLKTPKVVGYPTELPNSSTLLILALSTISNSFFFLNLMKNWRIWVWETVFATRHSWFLSTRHAWPAAVKYQYIVSHRDANGKSVKFSWKLVDFLRI